MDDHNRQKGRLPDDSEQTMKLFISCDWGTSSFRLRLVNGAESRTISAVRSNYGIAAAFEAWRKTKEPETNRLNFYLQYISEQVAKLKAAASEDISGLPILISGMASSSIGMLELPYKTVPLSANGSDLEVRTLPLQPGLPHPIIMISGACTEEDVLRGEETMLAGCRHPMDGMARLFIFPGTHSKHILVKDGQAIGFATYITGELFDLLSNKSILASSVQNPGLEASADDQFFTKGVLEGSISTLANSVFHVRTNQLFGKANPGQNYAYLSGLLIGHELKAITAEMPGSIILVSSQGIRNAYASALRVLGLDDRLLHQDADEALVNGQWTIMKQVEMSRA